MKKNFLVLFLFMLGFISVVPAHAATSPLATRLKGTILLQVESHGEAWYVNPADGLRYYLKDGDEAYSLMRERSLGITNGDLSAIPVASTAEEAKMLASACTSNATAKRLQGKILLQVQAHGEAWYVNPANCYRVYLKNGAEAYNVMRFLSLGITNSNIETIPTGSAPTTPTTVTATGSTGTSTPAPTPITISGFLSGTTIFGQGTYNAIKQVADWATTRPADSTLIQKIASQPTATWFGDWNKNIQGDVSALVTKAAAENKVPVLVAYNIPNRDCGSNFSAGGVTDAAAYHAWINSFAEGIGSKKAVVVLEPDAVALDCFNDARGAMLTDAVKTLEAKPNVAVYIDAGHPNWTPAATMADRLKKSGVANAEGFALNVSNFYKTSENVTFGNTLSKLISNKHYIIDTSRNANGWEGTWCNPQGAGIGSTPTTNTGEPLLDALLWIKPPGESDGNCSGGPNAGAWWPDYALKLVNNAK